MLSNENNKNQLISRRTFMFGICKLSLLSVLASRMYYMQLIKEENYKTLSDKNRITILLIAPARGQIYDRYNKTLATNISCFRLIFNKVPNRDYTKELEVIAEILRLPTTEYSYIKNKCARASFRSPISIYEQLSWHQISSIEENKPSLSSISIDHCQSRSYPNFISTSHLLGYTGIVSEKEASNLKLSNRTLIVGKSGLEKYHDEALRGSYGYKHMEVNAYGNYVRELSSVASVAGKNIHLNIDSELHEQIWPYLSEQGCSAIVMDIRNGSILVLASTPSYDSNNFNKLSTQYWQSLIDDPLKPLINKALQNSYPPGSAFKLITVLAALEAGIEPTKTVNCIGGASALGGNNFRCSSKQGHGRLDMFDALKYSCNTYMYEISRIVGADNIIAMAKKFGFGAKTNIDILGEVSGLVPTKKWKRDRFKSAWTIGDTLNLSIGQGYLLATPIQLVRFCASIANGGKLFTPRIAQSQDHYIQVDIKSQYLEVLKEGMFRAVNNQGGTAYTNRVAHANSEFKLAGKTITSQVRAKKDANDDLSRASIARKERNHAGFVGFGPYINPRLAISTFIDHGGGGGRVAVPLANQIMQDVFKKHH